MASFLSKITYNGEAVWEELLEPKASPTFTATRESRAVTRFFRVAQADMGTLFNECYPLTFPSVAQHPTYPYLYVKNVSGEPFPGHSLIEVGGGHSEPDFYIVTIDYGPLEQTDNSQDTLTGSVSFTTESMTLPGYGGLKWNTTGQVIKEPEVQPFLVIPISQWSIQIPRAKSIPWVAMRANRGRINSVAFWGAAPETVLYTGMNVTFRFSNNGQRQYDIEHHFNEKQIIWNGQVYGWNHYYDASNKRFDKILNDAGQPFYTAVNTFNQLKV